MLLITILSIWSILLVFSAFLTLVRDDYWIFRILEYPRLQKLLLVLLTLGGWLFLDPFSNAYQTAVFLLLCLTALYIMYKVWPYTVFSPKEIHRIDAGKAKDSIRVFTANVYQDNRDYGRMLRQIRSMDPDIIFLVETDEGWASAVKELEKEYPHSLREPLGNTYGLLLYSRFPVKEGRVSYLVKDGIPSAEAIVVLPSGQEVRIFGLHPEPPVPGESLSSSAKDKELMKVALKVRQGKLPCIVFGDLNDVAWSHTTELFRKTSRLLDPRRGRGFYSTFSAHSRFLRFPLDYIFCSREFQLVRMTRMPANGSDHFATFTHLAFQPVMQGENHEPEADSKEVKEAIEMSQQKVSSE
jgi:endonuclease/exonuclease/phosphatase (EEP) superfamily protein YafD